MPSARARCTISAPRDHCEAPPKLSTHPTGRASCARRWPGRAMVHASSHKVRGLPATRLSVRSCLPTLPCARPPARRPVLPANTDGSMRRDTIPHGLHLASSCCVAALCLGFTSHTLPPSPTPRARACGCSGINHCIASCGRSPEFVRSRRAPDRRTASLGADAHAAAAVHTDAHHCTPSIHSL